MQQYVNGPTLKQPKVQKTTLLAERHQILLWTVNMNAFFRSRTRCSVTASRTSTVSLNTSKVQGCHVGGVQRQMSKNAIHVG